MKTVSSYLLTLLWLIFEIARGQTWPLNTPDQLSSAFGPRNLGTAEYPDTGYDYDFHAGIDIGGSAYTEIKAIESGVVVEVGDDYFIVKSDTYDDWVQYLHVTHTLDENDPVTEGAFICQVADITGPHLDIKYYPLRPGEDKDQLLPHYREEGKRNSSWHPMEVLPFGDYDNNYEVVPTPYLDDDETGTYAEFYGRVDDQELDLVATRIFLEGDGYTTNQILIGDGVDGTRDHYVDFNERINCGDLVGANSDSGFNHPGIRIIPRIFNGGQWGYDNYHTVYFRFYLDENVLILLNGLDMRAEAVDVNDWYGVENGFFISSAWIDLPVGVCPPFCPPPGAPDPPTNLEATANYDPVSVDLTWDGYYGSFGFFVIYRRPYGTDPIAFQTIDITGVNNYKDTHFIQGAQYYYAVAAVNEIGESLNSNEVLVTAPTWPPENLTLENLSIGTTKVYIATNSITAGPNFTVENTGDVTFQAGSIITLLPGFTSVAGSKFHAYIDTSLGGGSQSMIAATVPEVQIIEEQTTDEEADEAIPTVYSLSHNYPNPFNAQTTLKYALKEDTRVSLKIYNLLGQEVRTLVKASQPAAYYAVVWDGKNNWGQPVSSGIYIYRVIAGPPASGFVKSRKMLLLK